MSLRPVLSLVALTAVAVAGCGNIIATPNGGSTSSGSTSSGGGSICGGFAYIECPMGEFCDFANGTCGESDLRGVCKTIPTNCPKYNHEGTPVCGCDGKTYEDECHASEAGTSVAHTGLCTPPPGQACGNNSQCSTGQFCRYDDQQVCGATDGPGHCEPIPTNCAQTNSLVCACDQQTYENRCEANAMGLSVLHDGPCVPPMQDCGGWNPTPCPADAFCNWPAGSTCGGGDIPGHCQARRTNALSSPTRYAAATARPIRASARRTRRASAFSEKVPAPRSSESEPFRVC